MQVQIKPSNIKGSIVAAASKSAMQRACAAALLHKGETVIHNPGSSNDDKAALEIIRNLGAKIETKEASLRIASNGVAPITDAINCGESGLSIRMFTPIVALCDKPIKINGTGSLVSRPMDFFDEILPQLSVRIISNNGKLPLEVQGPIKATDIVIDGSLSSQFLTGLLLAYAASPIEEEVTIHVNELKSKPYIDLTLDLMKAFDLPLPENKEYKHFVFNKRNQLDKKETTINYTVESDWSGGAFLLVAGAIAAQDGIKVSGLDINSTQADKAIVLALQAAGADMVLEDGAIYLTNKNELKAFDFDATDCPDLFPPLVALAAYCNDITIIKGLSRLKHKESDRGITLQQEFAKFGIKIDLNGDEMLIHGKRSIIVQDQLLSSHHDHRIAMAVAVAALKADKEIFISHADAVNKSYPSFYEHLKQLGVVVSL